MSGEIAPFDRDDGIDKVIVLADEHPRFGVFVFPCRLLTEKDIFSEQSIGGNARFGLRPLGDAVGGTGQAGPNLAMRPFCGTYGYGPRAGAISQAALSRKAACTPLSLPRESA